MVTIFPTIDVEGVHGHRPFEQMVLGEVDDSETWGVYRLAETFKQWNISATFFVDCYEHTFWQEPALEEVCIRLLDLGQDVQLHTHPSWRDDKRDFDHVREMKRTQSYLPQNLDFMAKLTLDQQMSVLNDGIDLLHKWTGKKPIAHRSGGYSVNQDTITALRNVSIPIDSSVNRNHPNTQLDWTTNGVIERHGVIQVPVTLYDCLFLPISNRKNIKIWSKRRKTDLDVCTLADLSWYVEAAERLNLKIMNLFMHSYSLLKYDNGFRSISPNPHQLQKLDSFLRYGSENSDVQFMNMTEFLEQYNKSPEEFIGSDVVPRQAASIKIIGLAVGKVKRQIQQLMSRVSFTS
jgi:hypothetical protein